MLVTRSLTTQRAARRARRGFTLGEMIVALFLFSLIGGGILTLVMRQQRFYRSTAEIIKVQGQLRQGASVLPLDLRMVSTSDTLVNDPPYEYNADIYAKNDWSIEFRRIVGSSLICRRRLAAPRDTIILYPKVLDSVAAVSSWGITPIPGDSILVLDDWSMVGPGDDRWRAYEIKSITAVTGNDGCPWKVPGDSTSLLYESENGRSSYKIVLKDGSQLSQTVIPGAPVRFFRRVRYLIYEAADLKWYLGYADCHPTYDAADKCGEVSPVSGPYSPYTGISTENGLTFAYYDSLGNELDLTAESRHIARIDVVMRSATATHVTRTGSGAGEPYRDSLMFSIGIRNRR